MRKNLAGILSAFLCVALTFMTGCSSDDKDPIEPKLAVNPLVEKIEFSQDGQKAYSDGKEISTAFAVSTNQSSWDVVVTPKEAEEWCKAIKNKAGNGFDISAVSEVSGVTVPATITLSAGDATPIVITVTREPKLKIDPQVQNLEFSLDGTKAYSGEEVIAPVFTVFTDQSSWEVKLDAEAEAAGWYKVEKSKDNTGFTVSAKAHNSVDAPAPATITVTAGTARPIEITVTQQTIPTFKVGDYWPDANAVYKDGELISGEAAQGIVYWLDEKHDDYRDGSSTDGTPFGTKGMVMNLDHNSLFQWSTKDESTNAKNSKDGLANMAAIQKISNDFADYPVFAWVHSKNPSNTKYTSGAMGIWYIPAKEEFDVLNNVYIKYTDSFNQKINMAVKNIISTRGHWLSTESSFGIDRASQAGFSVDYLTSIRKSDKFRGLAIRDFSR